MTDQGQQIGQKMRAARRASGLTQEEVADYLKVDKITVSRWETGARRIKAEDYHKAMELFANTSWEPGRVVNQTVGQGSAASRESDARFEAFTRELLRAGSTDAEVDFFAYVLRRPETARLIQVSESASPLPDAAVAAQWDALLDDFRALAHRWIAKRETKPVRPAIKPKDMPAAIAKELAARDAEKPKRRAK